MQRAIATIILCAALSLGAAAEGPEQPAPAPQPQQEILTPDTARVGQLVHIDVSLLGAQSYDWQVIPTTDNFLQFDGGQQVVFSAEAAGDYRFYLAWAQDGKVKSKTWVIKITSPVPVIPPPPPNAFSDKVAAWCGPIETADKGLEVIRLAQSFRSVAGVLQTGVITDVNIIIKSTAASNNAALGTSAEAWNPFFVAMKAELLSLQEAGKLNDWSDHVVVWRNIADALDQYAAAS